jgi:hypothetical protein
MIESQEKETHAMMTESEVGALLDAHDALVKACVDSVLTQRNRTAAGFARVPEICFHARGNG